MATPINIKCLDVEEETLATTTFHCKICLTNASKYTCPRCNIAYCSVTCYKDEKHTGCSEAFYKDCVVTELQDMTNSESDKKKVLEMLTRDLEERADDEDVVENDEEDHQSLSDRLEGLDLDKDVSAVWGQLSAKEREEFARMLQDGRLARLIELWTPWWKCPKNLSLVKESSKTRPGKEWDSTRVPDTLADIPDINILLKNSRPSSDCRFDLINILFAYAFVSRMHNGDHHECPVDSSQLLLDTSIVLHGECRCGSVGEAIQQSLDAVDKTTKAEEKPGPTGEFSLTVLEDVLTLISGPGTAGHSLGFMVAVLSDIAALLKKSLSLVKKEVKGKRKEDDSLRVLKSLLFKAEKKSVFFLSWLQRYGMGMHQLIPVLQLEIERRKADAQEMGELKECVEKNMDHLRPGLNADDQPHPPSSSNGRSKIVEL